MDLEHDNVRKVVEEDRLSSLPDELIHKILACLDIKFAVQTSSISSRWKLLWTSIPHLNFSSGHFDSLRKFSKFVTHVLSGRNHQAEVSSVKLRFDGAASQVFVRRIANYAFTHNVNELTIISDARKHQEFPLCLFSSRSLAHFSLRTEYFAPRITPRTPWDFPALTTLHLCEITLCDDSDETTSNSLDIFSKCVNLKNLTLERFLIKVEVFHIITPKLANLKLIDSKFGLQVVNLIAPQLEDLVISCCSIKHLNAPPGLSSLFYSGYCPLQFSTNGFHSLGKVTLHLYFYPPVKPNDEEQDTHQIINMLQELHSVKNLTLNTDTVECLSSSPHLLSHHPSPFDNLESLKIEAAGRKDAYNFTMSTQVRNFLLENSPSTTFVVELPKPPPTKSMKQKEAREKKKAKQETEIQSTMVELQVLLEQGKSREAEWAKKKAELKSDLLDLLVKSAVLLNLSQNTEGGELVSSEIASLVARMNGSMDKIRAQCDEETAEVRAVLMKKIRSQMLLEKLPKRQQTKMDTQYSQLLEETEVWWKKLQTNIMVTDKLVEGYGRILSDYFPTFPNVNSHPPSASEPSSSSGNMPTSSTVTPLLSAPKRPLVLDRAFLDKYF